MKSVIVFACLLTVAYALPQIRDRDCPCQDYDKCTTIGSYDHTVCICPSGDKYLLSEEPYFNCTLPQLNPCTEDPCGGKAVCVAAQGGNVAKLGPFVLRLDTIGHFPLKNGVSTFSRALQRNRVAT